MEQILDDRIDEECGPLVYAMESEEDQQRSLDSTCKKLYRFRTRSRGCGGLFQRQATGIVDPDQDSVNRIP